MRPHRRQLTRLPCPWDSPGKNTGVGCHFLLQCVKVKSDSEVTQSCPTLSDPMDCSPPGSSIHGTFQARVLEWGAIAFSGKAGLVVLNSLSFCLSVKLLISPSYLNEILTGYSNLGCRFSSFITLSMFCHSLLAWRVSIERSAVILMGIPLCVICCFSLAAFNICSLCLIFVNLINMCLGVFCRGFILFGTLWVSWTWWLFPSPF